MTSQAIGDALYGIQGMSSNVDEVLQLVGELAKKIATTGAVLTPRDIGRALFGLQKSFAVAIMRSLLRLMMSFAN